MYKANLNMFGVGFIVLLKLIKTMKFRAIIKRRFSKYERIVVYAEDMYYAILNIEMEYPKHKLIKIIHG